MFEMMLCSLLTLLPDYLFRRYVQGKRIGKEITFYSVWYELRWGITTCLILGSIFFATGLLGEQIAGQRAELLEVRRRLDEISAARDEKDSPR